MSCQPGNRIRFVHAGVRARGRGETACAGETLFFPTLCPREAKSPHRPSVCPSVRAWFVLSLLAFLFLPLSRTVADACQSLSKLKKALESFRKLKEALESFRKLGPALSGSPVAFVPLTRAIRPAGLCSPAPFVSHPVARPFLPNLS